MTFIQDQQSRKQTSGTHIFDLPGASVPQLSAIVVPKGIDLGRDGREGAGGSTCR